MSQPSAPPLPPSPPRAAWVGLAIYVLILLVLPVLKLASFTRVASWSWWWVMAPLWAPWVLVFLWSVFGPLFQKPQRDDSSEASV